MPRRTRARTLARLLLTALVLSLPGCVVLTCRI